MKKFSMLLMFLFLMPLQTMAVEQWKEGTHFEVLDKPKTKKPEIREYFSFWCPACFYFESIVGEIKKQMPKEVKFNKVHVNFMGFTGPEVQEDATRAMMIARALRREDELNAAVFNYIHKQRAGVTGLSDLRNIFVVNGVEPEKFDKMAASFGVKSLSQKNNKLIDEYRSLLSGVPNIIINGKYQAKFTRDMTPDQIVELILWLTELP